MLGLVSGSQGALPTNGQFWRPGTLPHSCIQGDTPPPQPLERGPVLGNEGNMGGKYGTQAEAALGV